jgi:hypothetical protein
MAPQNVAVVGANSDVGTAILRLLATSPDAFALHILQRASSTSTPPVPSANVVRTADAWSLADLTRALRSARADVVIAALAVKSAEDHMLLAEAAAAAGARRFIPADFGSLDARDATARRMVPLFGRKVQVRERLESLARQSAERAEEDGGAGFGWTSIVCGHLFDWGLRNGFLHVDLDTRRVELLDGGRAAFSASTLGRVAESVRAVLLRPEETRDRVLMVESFLVSQLDVLRALETASGRTWDVTHRESKPYIAELKERVDGGDEHAVEDLVYALGVVDGNWETKPDFAMDLLGLETQDLDEVIADVLSEGSMSMEWYSSMRTRMESLLEKK